MTVHRLSQLTGEVVVSPTDAEHRITQLVGEVVNDPQPPMRLTQLVAEVVYPNTAAPSGGGGVRAWFASF